MSKLYKLLKVTALAILVIGVVTATKSSPRLQRHQRPSVAIVQVAAPKSVPPPSKKTKKQDLKKAGYTHEQIKLLFKRHLQNKVEVGAVSHGSLKVDKKEQKKYNYSTASDARAKGHKPTWQNVTCVTGRDKERYHTLFNVGVFNVVVPIHFCVGRHIKDPKAPGPYKIFNEWSLADTQARVAHHIDKMGDITQSAWQGFDSTGNWGPTIKTYNSHNDPGGIPHQTMEISVQTHIQSCVAGVHGLPGFCRDDYPRALLEGTTIGCGNDPQQLWSIEDNGDER